VAKWGDEGKGKVVDLLSAGYPVVVRYNGGHNAGHTVRFGDRRFALHLVRPGHPRRRHLLPGGGDGHRPSFLVSEIDRLEAEGIGTEGRVFVSPRASLILATHQALDGVREQAPGPPKSAPPAAASAPPTRTRRSGAACVPICWRTASG